MATIILDMDSTITDLPTDWFALYNKMYNDDLRIENVLSWNTSLYCKAGKAVFDVLHTPGLFRNLKAFPNAIEVIERQYGRHELHIGTSITSEQEQREKREWLAEFLPFFPDDRIHYTKESHKNGLVPHADMLFDDGPHNIRAFPGMTAAFRYRYNEDAAPTWFVKDWLEFEELVNWRFAPGSPKTHFLGQGA